MSLSPTNFRSDVETTLFAELGQTATIRNITQSEDSQLGSSEGDPTNSDTQETIVIMNMTESKQKQEFGEFDPKRFRGYFKYNSVIEDQSHIIDSSNNEYEIDSLHDVNIAGNIIMKKAILYKNT